MACPYYDKSKDSLSNGTYCNKEKRYPGLRYWNCYCSGDYMDCPFMGGTDPCEADIETTRRKKAAREEERERERERERQQKEDWEKSRYVYKKDSSKDEEPIRTTSTTDTTTFHTEHRYGDDHWVNLHPERNPLPDWNEVLAWLGFLVFAFYCVMNQISSWSMTVSYGMCVIGIGYALTRGLFIPTSKARPLNIARGVAVAVLVVGAAIVLLPLVLSASWQLLAVVLINYVGVPLLVLAGCAVFKWGKVAHPVATGLAVVIVVLTVLSLLGIINFS